MKFKNSILFIKDFEKYSELTIKKFSITALTCSVICFVFAVISLALTWVYGLIFVFTAIYTFIFSKKLKALSQQMLAIESNALTDDIDILVSLDDTDDKSKKIKYNILKVFTIFVNLATFIFAVYLSIVSISALISGISDINSENDDIVIKSSEGVVSIDISNPSAVFLNLSNNQAVTGTFSVETDGSELSVDDFKLYSEDSNIATIDCTCTEEDLLSGILNYTITVGGETGETSVYILSTDGIIVSDKIKVVVEDSAPVESTTNKNSTTTTTTRTNIPRAYISAFNQAVRYNDTFHLSKKGLYDQLTSEYGGQFTHEAAQYAVNLITVDWQYNALQQAKDYNESQHLSKAALYDQLKSDYGGKFTAAEAQYAVDNIDADWNYNALMQARDYQDLMDMSPAAIHDQLTSEYGGQFTKAQADYAIAHL